MQHQEHLALAGFGIRLRLDVVASGIDPTRTSHDLKGLEGIRILHEHADKSVFGMQAAGKRANNMARSRGRIELDRCHVKSGRIGGLAEHHASRDRQENRAHQASRSGECPRCRPRLTQQPCDPVRQRTAVGGHGGMKVGRTRRFYFRKG